MNRKIAKAEKRFRLQEERNQLKMDLANEFKFFSATNEFRDGMLPEIIAVMRRYDRIGKSLRKYRGDVFPPLISTSFDADTPVVEAVEGDTLFFSTERRADE